MDEEKFLSTVFKKYPLPWSVSLWEGDVILDKGGNLVVGCGEVGNKEIFEAIVQAVNDEYQMPDNEELYANE
jgi:hypothetical protein